MPNTTARNSSKMQCRLNGNFKCFSNNTYWIGMDNLVYNTQIFTWHSGANVSESDSRWNR